MGLVWKHMRCRWRAGSRREETALNHAWLLRLEAQCRQDPWSHKAVVRLGGGHLFLFCRPRYMIAVPLSCFQIDSLVVDSIFEKSTTLAKSLQESHIHYTPARLERIRERPGIINTWSTSLRSTSSYNATSRKMASEPPAKRKCLGVDCNEEAGTLQCPTCLKVDIKDSFFCSQDCFKRSWVWSIAASRSHTARNAIRCFLSFTDMMLEHP